MTPEQVAAVGPAFASYLREFADCFVDDRSRDHLQTYCRGLLADLPRKSVEPIALAAGTAVRTLCAIMSGTSIGCATNCSSAGPGGRRQLPPMTWAAWA